MNYYRFFISNYKILLFGLVLVYFCSFGQTFLLSLYIPSFLNSFDITRTEYSWIYASATLLSAFTIIFAGKIIDRIDLKIFTLLVIGGIFIANIVAALSINLVLLFISIFLLRFFGQGMLSHTSMTTMGRYFHHARGKALSVAYLGFPLGEASLPIIIISLISFVGWRETFIITAALILLILLPFSLWTLSKFKAEDIVEEKPKIPLKDKDEVKEIDNERSFSQLDVLKSKNFLLFAPTVMLTGFTLTTLFFFQIFIADYKGWPAELMAAGITGYAAASIVFSILSGPMIDALSARKLFPFLLLPMAIGISILNIFDHSVTPFIFWTLTGISAGMHSPVINAIYAEVFGIKSLGSVRSLFTFTMVLSTALGPVVYSFFLDRGFTFNDIHWGIVVLIIVLSIALFISQYPKKSTKQPKHISNSE
ncbi:MAG: MFS transporter [Bacteroidales bacterium]